MANTEWSRDEYLVVLDLYLNHDIREDSTDPQVQQAAKLINRSANSVGLRLGNYRHLDPESTTGLSHVSAASREIWEEFVGNNDELAEAADGARERLAGSDSGGTSGGVQTGERTTEQPVRVGQSDFRMRLRERFHDSCLLCGISRPGLLQAGHILSWSENETYRGDPENGLLLCYTHHRAFDIGLFTLTEDFEIAVSPHFQDATGFMKRTISDREGAPVQFPGDRPNPEFLRKYNQGLEWMK